MTTSTDFTKTFTALRGLFAPYADKLTVTADTKENYALDAAYSEKWKKVIFFGAVQLKKNYVSLHLMPVYMYPELLKGISKTLKARMQGKSCFNFKSLDEATLVELKQLVKAAFARFKSEGLV